MYWRFSALPSRTRRPQRGFRQGFTLVELLVVITIIAMLVGLLVPAVMAARNAGRKTQCMNNQQNLGKGILNYVTTKEKFPPLFSLQPDPVAPTATPAPFVGWVPPILPYIEQNPLYTQYQNNTLKNQATAEIDTLICPSRNPNNSVAPLDYVVNGGAQDAVVADKQMDFQENGVFFDAFTPTRYDVTPASNRPRVTPPIDLAYLTTHDGTKATIMLSESTDALDWYELVMVPATYQFTPLEPGSSQSGKGWWNAMTWLQPTAMSPMDFGTTGYPTGQILNIPAPVVNDPNMRTDVTSARPASNHSGGFFVTFCDGHTQFMSQDIEYRVYTLLMSPDSNAAKSRATATLGQPVVYPTSWLVNMTAGEPLKALTDADINK